MPVRITNLTCRQDCIRFPEQFGIARALLIARVLHIGAFAALVALYWITHLGIFALIGVVATAALLFYQHRLVQVRRFE